MIRCVACGERMFRVPRTKTQKIFLSALYQCRACRKTFGTRRAFALDLHTHAKCPHCGTERLKVLRRRDHIDKLYRGPLSVLQGMLGARLYHCAFCRLQFHDFRPLRAVEAAASREQREAEPAGPRCPDGEMQPKPPAPAPLP